MRFVHTSTPKPAGSRPPLASGIGRVRLVHTSTPKDSGLTPAARLSGQIPSLVAMVVAFADGSVRFLGESIDPKVFEAMSTIAGGEANLTDDQ